MLFCHFALRALKSGQHGLHGGHGPEQHAGLVRTVNVQGVIKPACSNVIGRLHSAVQWPGNAAHQKQTKEYGKQQPPDQRGQRQCANPLVTSNRSIEFKLGGIKLVLEQCVNTLAHWHVERPYFLHHQPVGLLDVVGTQRSKRLEQPFLHKCLAVLGKFFGQDRFLRITVAGRIDAPHAGNGGNIAFDRGGGTGNHVRGGGDQCHCNGQAVAHQSVLDFRNAPGGDQTLFINGARRIIGPANPEKSQSANRHHHDRQHADKKRQPGADFEIFHGHDRSDMQASAPRRKQLAGNVSKNNERDNSPFEVGRYAT